MTRSLVWLTETGLMFEFHKIFLTIHFERLLKTVLCVARRSTKSKYETVGEKWCTSVSHLLQYVARVLAVSNESSGRTL